MSTAREIAQTTRRLPHDGMSRGRPVGGEPHVRSDGGLEQLIRGGRLAVVEQSFADSQGLFAEGDEARFFYKVESGVVRLSHLLADGRRQIVQFCLPGAFFGLGALRLHATAAEAIGGATVLRLSRRRLDEVLCAEPATGRAVLELLTVQLAEAQGRMLMLGRKTPSEKLASFLLEMAGLSLGDGGAPGWIHLPVKRQDMADFLGLTIETVSRLFTRFRAAGLIELADPTTLRLKDRDALEEIAEGLAEA